MEHAPLVASTHPVWASAEVAAAARADQPGAVIRHVRQAAGLTLDQLGSLYGCSASTLSRIERGQPPVDQIGVRRRLARLLGIPDELVGLAPRPTRCACSAAGSTSRYAAGRSTRRRSEPDETTHSAHRSWCQRSRSRRPHQ
ncbi:helix-turn-helix domain-containing protein [Actinoplanes philippinensis]|uniref:helix-turn-helix domain-containing protein n=1 Tax=Actinoplanes philippinensis TaxID=35752 RepID=UPI003411446B